MVQSVGGIVLILGIVGFQGDFDLKLIFALAPRTIAIGMVNRRGCDCEQNFVSTCESMRFPALLGDTWLFMSGHKLHMWRVLR
jgi:hypothetical protein